MQGFRPQRLICVAMGRATIHRVGMTHAHLLQMWLGWCVPWVMTELW